MYINNCLSCLQAKSPKHETLTPPLNPVSSNTSFPCDLLQVDIVGQLPKSGRYSYIITAMDVFSKYMFAQAVTSPSAEVIAKILMQWFLRHSYIPLAILTDRGSAFTSQLLSELAKMLEIRINLATLKHAQTIGLLERSHGPLKRYLRIYENQVKHDWHKFVDLAVFQHNTSFHIVPGCPPSLIFHGRIPINPIDLRFNDKTLPNVKSKYDYISDIQSKMFSILGETKENLIASFNKYRDYYDKKANAAPLKLHEFCLLLHPQISREREKVGKLQCKWVGVYRVEKVLTSSNYLVRKVNTNFTQIVHRVRLKPFKPQTTLKDIENIDELHFEEDPLIAEAIKEPQLFDSQIENTVYLPIDKRSTAFISTKVQPEPAQPVLENNVLPPTREETPHLDASPRSTTPEPSRSPSPIFQTPENSPRTNCTNEQQATQSKQSQQKIPEPTLSIPSNLSKILQQKKQERQVATQPSSTSQTDRHQTSKSNIPKPINQSMTGPQVQNTTSRYGRQRKQTQFFTHGT